MQRMMEQREEGDAPRRGQVVCQAGSRTIATEREREEGEGEMEVRGRRGRAAAEEEEGVRRRRTPVAPVVVVASG